MNQIKNFLSIKFIKSVIKNPSVLLKNSFFRYLIIGFSTFFFDFLIYQLLVSIVHLDEVISNITSTLIVLFYNFTLSNYWTFKAGPGIRSKKIAKYIIVALYNYFFNNLSFAFLVKKFGLPGLIAKAIVTAMIVSWNFFLYKYWVFKKDKPESIKE